MLKQFLLKIVHFVTLGNFPMELLELKSFLNHGDQLFGIYLVYNANRYLFLLKVLAVLRNDLNQFDPVQIFVTHIQFLVWHHCNRVSE